MTRGWVEEADRGTSGQVRVRMDPDLHRRLTDAAKADSVSLNTLITQILERAMKRRR